MDDESRGSEGCCVSCGFLSAGATADRLANVHYYAVGIPARKSGELFEVGEPGHRLTSRPMCIRGVADLSSEVLYHVRAPGPNGDRPDNREACLRVLHVDRKCSKWFEHTPGLSPSEHLVELRIQLSEVAQQQIQDERHNDSRRFNRILILIGVLSLAFAAATFGPDSYLGGLLTKIISSEPGNQVESFMPSSD